MSNTKTCLPKKSILTTQNICQLRIITVAITDNIHFTNNYSQLKNYSRVLSVVKYPVVVPKNLVASRYIYKFITA